MKDYDEIVGWIWPDGTYHCWKHTLEQIGCIAVFNPKQECPECKLQASLDEQKNFWKGKE